MLRTAKAWTRTPIWVVMWRVDLLRLARGADAAAPGGNCSVEATAPPIERPLSGLGENDAEETHPRDAPYALEGCVADAAPSRMPCSVRTALLRHSWRPMRPPDDLLTGELFHLVVHEAAPKVSTLPTDSARPMPFALQSVMVAKKDRLKTARIRRNSSFRWARVRRW